MFYLRFQIWNAVTGEEVLSLQHNHIVKSVNFSTDEHLFVTGSNEKIIRVFDLNKLDAGEYRFYCPVDILASIGIGCGLNHLFEYKISSHFFIVFHIIQSHINDSDEVFYLMNRTKVFISVGTRTVYRFVRITQVTLLLVGITSNNERTIISAPSDRRRKKKIVINTSNNLNILAFLGTFWLLWSRLYTRIFKRALLLLLLIVE